MLKQVQSSVKKYLNFRTFIILFILEAVMILGVLVFVESAATFTSKCKETKVDFSGKLNDKTPQTHKFNYSGGSCYLLVLPSWKPQDDLSLWLYRPDGKIEVLDPSRLVDEKTLVIQEAQKGEYRLSVHNSKNKAVNYVVSVFLGAK